MKCHSIDYTTNDETRKVRYYWILNIIQLKNPSLINRLNYSLETKVNNKSNLIRKEHNLMISFHMILDSAVFNKETKTTLISIHSFANELSDWAEENKKDLDEFFRQYNRLNNTLPIDDPSHNPCYLGKRICYYCYSFINYKGLREHHQTKKCKRYQKEHNKTLK